MEKAAVIGLDIAKQVFQVHGVNEASAIVCRRRLRRNDVVAFSRGGKLLSLPEGADRIFLDAVAEIAILQDHGYSVASDKGPGGFADVRDNLIAASSARDLGKRFSQLSKRCGRSVRCPWMSVLSGEGRFNINAILRIPRIFKESLHARGASCWRDAPIPCRKMTKCDADIRSPLLKNKPRALDPSWGEPWLPATANARPS